MTDKIEVPRELLQSLAEMLDRADTSEGYCCCGDSMQNHPSPMYCGHSPVDMGDYYAGKLRDELKALLREAAQPETALSKYREFTSDGEDEDPVERLRFFCAQALGGQDWLDCERFFDDLKHRTAAEELRMDAERYRWLLDRCYRWPDAGRVCNEFDQSEGVAIWTKRSVGDDPCGYIDAAIAAEKKENP